jgi:peroxiredoxin (alkyl hydroperoxide reductase subunit C)
MSRITVNERIPGHVFYVFKSLDDNTLTQVSTTDLFANKRVIVFGTPGAFTSVCSSKHIPDFQSKYEQLRHMGIDLIACTAVNGTLSIQ